MNTTGRLLMSEESNCGFLIARSPSRVGDFDFTSVPCCDTWSRCKAKPDQARRLSGWVHDGGWGPNSPSRTLAAAQSFSADECLWCLPQGSQIAVSGAVARGFHSSFHRGPQVPSRLVAAQSHPPPCKLQHHRRPSFCLSSPTLSTDGTRIVL